MEVSLFLSLPEEMLEYILKKLDARSLSNARLTCSTLATICPNDMLLDAHVYEMERLMHTHSYLRQRVVNRSFSLVKKWVPALLRSNIWDPSYYCGMPTCPPLLASLCAFPVYYGLIKSLLEDGRCDPSAEENEALYVACESGHGEYVKLLLADPRVDPSLISTDQTKHTPLAIACKRGHENIVRILLADGRCDPGADDNIALYQACTYNRVEIVCMLLADPLVSPTAPNPDDPNGYGFNDVLCVACGFGHAHIVRALLDDPRIDPSVQDSNNELPLVYAAQCGSTKVVAMLLSDARVNPGALSNAAMYAACSKGRVAVVELLMQHYPRANPFRVDGFQQFGSPFGEACAKGHEGIVQMLLEDPRFPHDFVDEPPCIALAVIHEHYEIFRILQRDGRFDPCASDNFPLRVAIEYGEEMLVADMIADERVKPGTTNFENAFRCAQEHGVGGEVITMVEEWIKKCTSKRQRI